MNKEKLWVAIIRLEKEISYVKTGLEAGYEMEGYDIPFAETQLAKLKEEYKKY